MLKMVRQQKTLVENIDFAKITLSKDGVYLTKGALDAYNHHHYVHTSRICIYVHIYFVCMTVSFLFPFLCDACFRFFVFDFEDDCKLCGDSVIFSWFSPASTDPKKTVCRGGREV